MNITLRSTLLVATALAATTLNAGTLPRNESVHLDRATLVGDTEIPPGTYRLELAPGLDSVSFLLGKKVVAVAPCTVGFARAVYPGTAVHYRTGGEGHDRLVKIVFASANVAVAFGADPAGGGEAAVAKAAEPH